MAEPFPAAGVSRRLAISAFGIHTGGGLVLLDELLAAAGSSVRWAAIDARRATVAPSHSIARVPVSVVSRIRVLLQLGREVAADDVLLCFNSLPPLRRAGARTVVYVHSPQFAGMLRTRDFPLRTRLRLHGELLLFRLGIRNADEVWVQSRTMARAMAPRVGRAAVRVMPFVAARFADAAREHLAGPRRDASFLYPADASAHKNHPNLLRAWALLEADGIAPPLALTLPPESLTMVLAAAGLTAAPRSVRNLGPVPHAEVLAMFAARHALVFPSTAETFGLPLIEAASAGTAIVASERDFVRDVCMPDQSFDPASPASIAAAVRRHMGIPAPLHPLLDARRFVEALLT